MKWGGRFVSLFLLVTLRQICVQPGLEAGLVRGSEERGWVLDTPRAQSGAARHEHPRADGSTLWTSLALPLLGCC